MDITRIKSDLAANALGVVKMLLPKGVKKQNEWLVGSVDGAEGKSLGVHLSGIKAGVWSDFATGDGGDLLDLWCKTRGIALGEALKQAEDWLGISTPAPALKPRKEYRKPPKPKCVIPQGKVRDYLCEFRNIPGHIVDAYKVGEQGDVIVFPFLLPDGSLPLVKVRKAEDGAKPKPTTADCEPVLFGWQAIPENSREVVICEGEIDALSWAAYGFPALSVPFGGGGGAKQQWIENEYERLQRFEKIYLALDMDEPGEAAAKEIASRLGRHRCYRVSIPQKDSNACLVDGVSKAVMQEAVRTAASLDPEGLRRPTDFEEQVVQLFWPADGVHVGYRAPYERLKDKLLFRPAEVSLWTGASGAGKSQILSDCTVDWLRQGSRICVASLEMQAASTLKRMCKQTAGVDRPTGAAIGASLRWMANGLLLYDKVGKATVANLIEVFDYARGKYGCDQFIVDSLMRLGVASDDHVGQEKAIYDMVNWAVGSKVHLHIVAHARKAGINSGAPETEDVKGASEIGSNSFNILSVWRNRSLEDDIKKLEAAGHEEQAAKLRESPPVIFNVAKQRTGDFEGKIGLWFDQTTYRYHSTHDKRYWHRQYIENSDVTDIRSVREFA